MRYGSLLAVLAVLATAPGALAQEAVHEGHVPEEAMSGMTASSGSDSPVRQAYNAASQKMHADMALPPGDDPDRLFAQQMIPHHEGAIEMARIELEHGTDPELRKLAEEIIAAQEREVAFLKEWLARQPAAE